MPIDLMAFNQGWRRGMGDMLQVLYRSCGRDGMPSIVVDSILCYSRGIFSDRLLEKAACTVYFTHF